MSAPVQNLFWKRQVHSSPNFPSLFIVKKDYSSVLFWLNQYILYSKEPIKVNIFETFQCSGQNSSIFVMSILKRQFDSSPNFVSLFSFMKDYSSVLFLAKTTYTLLKKSSLKWRFLRLSSAQVRICRFPYVNFITTNRFFSKFCITLEFHERKLLCTFLAQTVYALLKRSSLKWKVF